MADRAESRSRGGNARWLIATGGLALAAAPFLVWIRVALIGDLTLFTLTSTARQSALLPWGAVLVGTVVAAAAGAIRDARYVRMIAIGLGSIAALYAGALLVGLARDVDQTYGFAALGLGPLVAAGGSLAIICGGAALKEPAHRARRKVPAPGPVVAAAPAAPTRPPVASANRLGAVRAAPIVVGIVVSLAIAAGVAAYLIGREGSAETLRRVCHNGYCLKLPTGWRYRDASFPSDHTTYFYWNPDNALEQLTIIGSGCVGCVTKNQDGVTPDPTGILPPTTTNVREISPYEVRYTTYEGVYPTRGFVYVLHDEKGVTGAFIFGLDLPASERERAARIIDSFVLEDA